MEPQNVFRYTTIFILDQFSWYTRIDSITAYRHILQELTHIDYKDRCLPIKHHEVEDQNYAIVYLVLIYILLLNEMYSKLSIVS